jgi:hypothetical protein
LPIETHALDPARVLKTVSALGGRPKRVLLLGCEPTPLDAEADPVMELNAPVAAAVDEAAALVESLVEQVREHYVGWAPVPAEGPESRSHALRGNAVRAAPRPHSDTNQPPTQSVEDGIPTQSVGTRL